MDSKRFAQQFLLDEVKKMKASDVQLNLLISMVHGIETAGALLDPLPFKAKGQGKKRFAIAVRKLFPAEYANANRQLDLYGQLRSHLAHCMLPANSIVVHSNAVEQHLGFSEKVLHISLEVLYNDYCCAIEQLIEQLEEGKLKNKNIMFDNLESLSK
ncbi:MAG: hypothetical protein K9J17_05640 [Flavobacteriales bacterium]|nr:hypothetical protein [Flavobacteriales bacterium]